MTSKPIRWYFLFFFVSGFCSLLYETIWLRLAMSQFGVTTAMVSIVLAAFMGGMGLGSWGAGYVLRIYRGRSGFPPLFLYAAAELFIGISGFLVPYELSTGRWLLQQMVLSFAGHYALAGIWVSLSLVPWCGLMGATFPFAMMSLKTIAVPDNEHSFSYLYLANVLGAIVGATIPLLMIELYGFRHTLYIGATLNFLLAASALALALATRVFSTTLTEKAREEQAFTEPKKANVKLMWLLFGTGLTSMSAELIWTRLYTPAVGTLVYAFAVILTLYLAATYVGSWYYRRHRNVNSPLNGLAWFALGVAVLFPLVATDPRMPLFGVIRVLFGVAPLAGVVGFVTPKIIDLFSRGTPELAGKAYAVNIVGCVIGPLVGAFLLLPWFGERWGLVVLSVPWFLTGLASLLFREEDRNSLEIAVSFLLVASAATILFSTRSFEDQFEPRQVIRDSTATVIATGSGFEKRLIVNGVGMTSLTPITKTMAHLPLAMLSHPPSNALTICFGMGTSHRSALSWHINSTVVELVPSVPVLFPYFHPKSTVGLDSPLSHVIIDDGRAYLERTREQFDVIVIDPPPPTGAAASSLLYSKQFYAIVKQRLRAGGILQQWFPGGDPVTEASVVRAFHESFPYVRVFRSVEHLGIHLLASIDHPLPNLSPSELARRLPADAVDDFVEWGPASTPEEQFKLVLDQELSVDSLLQEDANAPVLEDDRPVNEFLLIRTMRQPGYLQRKLKRLEDVVRQF